MLCWKDRTYCTKAKVCSSAANCKRFLSDAEAQQAAQAGYPISWSDFSSLCNWFKEKKNEEKAEKGDVNEKGY